MKKTLSLLLAAILTFSLTAANFMLAPQKTINVGAPVKIDNLQKAPKALQAKKMASFAAKLKATPNFPASTADDLVGGYDWAYRQYTGGPTTQPDTLATDKRDQEDNIQLVGMTKTDEGKIRITNLFLNSVVATMGTTGGYTTFTVDADQVVYTHSSYGDCTFEAIFYYEGDATYDAGWYITDLIGFIIDEGIILDPDTHFYMTIKDGDYAGYRLGWIYEPESVMVPDSDYNALMTYTTDGVTKDYPVKVSEDANYVVTIAENFGGFGENNPITFTLAEDKTWTAPTGQLIFTYSNNNYRLYGTDGSDLFDLAGTGTDKVLTFGSDWTGYDSSTGYWIGQQGAATITRIDDDVFAYPGDAVDPALYLIGTFNDWDQENMVPFTKGDDGKWTVTQQMAAGAQFKLKDEAGNWLGGVDENAVGYFEVLEGMVTDGTEITLTDGSNFLMPVAGTWTITVDKENNKMVISGEWVNPEPEKDHVYILGEVNGNAWDPTVGDEMETEDGILFTKDVVCNADNSGYSYFSFTTKLAETAGDWDGIVSYRMGAESNDLEVTDELLGTELTVKAGTNAFKVLDGEYTLTLNLDNMKLVIAKKGAAAIKGDVNADGVVDVDDVNAVIAIMLGKAAASDYDGDANVDGEGIVDVDDVNAIIAIMLGK